MSDLREAAGRLRKANHDSSRVAEYRNEKENWIRDNVIVADAYLAEQDDTPIDEQWLRTEMGGEKGVDRSMVYIPITTRHGRSIALVFDASNCGPAFHFESRDSKEYMFVELPPITTRGQLRKLLSALGIPSDEAGGEK